MNKVLYKIHKLIHKLRFEKAKKIKRNDMIHLMSINPIYEGSQEEYEEKVIPFWSKYNYKPGIMWYKYHGYLSQSFDPKIIPADLFYGELYPYLNNIHYDLFIENKLLLDFFLNDIERSKNIIKFINGCFLDCKHNLVSKSEAFNILKNHGKAILKPSDNEQGRGIEIIDFSLDNANDIFNKKLETGDFVIQELIKQSPQLSSFNESSVNTIRVISTIINDKVEVVSSICRIGGEGSVVDNYSQGGESRPIDRDGFLLDYSFQKEKIRKTNRYGVEYKKEKLMGYDRVISAIKKAQPNIAYMRFIGWDFAIDSNYNPVLIEINGYAGDNQREEGPTFKEFTEDLLDEYFSYKKNN